LNWTNKAGSGELGAILQLYEIKGFGFSDLMIRQAASRLGADLLVTFDKQAAVMLQYQYSESLLGMMGWAESLRYRAFGFRKSRDDRQRWRIDLDPSGDGGGSRLRNIKKCDCV
jgi:hypothetical protein